MILYNILHYHNIHRCIRLTELNALINILLWKRILWSNRSLNRFLLTCQCFVTVTKCKLAEISEKKNSKQIFPSRARRRFRDLTSIRQARFNSGQISKSLETSFTTTIFKSSSKDVFSQWQLPSATGEKQTNIECQKLLVLILVSNSRRYSLHC